LSLLRVPREQRPLLYEVQQRHPRFRDAVVADARILSHERRDERDPTTTLTWVLRVLYLTWATDAFGALVLYRLRTSCQRRGIPVIPRVAHRLSMMWAQVSIGDPVLVHPGVILPHGQVVIDGFCEIGPGARLRPWTTIGRVSGPLHGPTLEPGVKVGTGAKVLGPITIGEGAEVGANAVVLTDVAPGTVVVGAPARPVRVPAP
jgi:serine O-acetyltransferase